MRTKGFTLIELLVVIAIIGILATIVMVALGSAQVKSRDAKRTADLKTFTTALELYYNDNGHYPFTASWTGFDGSTYSTNLTYDNSTHTGTGKILSQAMAPYVRNLSDPGGVKANAGYLYLNTTTSGENYCILFWRTPENLNDFPTNLIPPNRCSAWDSAGQCTDNISHSGWGAAIYHAVGTYAAGC